MSTPTRATLLNKLFKVLRRTYKHAPLKGEQLLLESLLFACCLENAHQQTAQDSFTKLQGAFFDWNEILFNTERGGTEDRQTLFCSHDRRRAGAHHLNARTILE